MASNTCWSPSPHSSYLPSPTDSPPDSISSLPSIRVLVLFLLCSREPTAGLIIPSLTLPAALPQPTQYGRTLGGIRLFITGEDVVDPGIWEETDEGSVLRASTDWVEHRDPHGLENRPNISGGADSFMQVSAILPIIHSPFYSLLEIIDPNCQPSATLSPSENEDSLIDALATHIPVIVFRYGLDRTRFPSRPHMSSFRPSSASALRNGLFRSPETLLSLRYEAAGALFTLEGNRTRMGQGKMGSRMGISVFLMTLQLGHARILLRTGQENVIHRPAAPSILFNPAKARIMNSVSTFMRSISDCRVRMAMVGSFCIGVGVGWMLR
ncbi:hypothetical protein EDD16DRAFT_1777979 [Pisolithus croceorrhizus]|nr:hypothetical protein EDD16DRAFT_1777979 [Pisolithus croceorrhizus]